MAKKRRSNGRRPQREKSPSAIKQLTNVAKAALAVGSGVALFNNSKFGRTIGREIIPAIAKTAKTYNDSLLGTNRKAIDIYDAYQKAIGKKGEAFKKTLKQVRETESKYKIKLGNERNMPGFLHNLEQTTRSRGYNEINKDALDTLERKAIRSMVAQYGDKYDPKIIKQIVRSTVKERKQLMADDQLGLSFIEDTLKNNNIGTEDAQKLVKDVLDIVGQKKSKTLAAHERELAKPLMESLKKKALEFKKTDTRDNLFLNKFGKKLGIKNLEDKLLGSRAMTIKEVLEHEDLLDVESIDELNRVIKDIVQGEDISFNSINEIKKLIKKDNEWGNVIFDRNLRARIGKDGDIEEIFSTHESSKFMKDMIDKFNATIPGKIITKGIDFRNMKDTPGIVFYHKGDKSILSQFDADAISNELEEMKVSVRSGFLKHKVFAVERDAVTDQYKLGEELSEGFVFKMDRGTIPRIVKNWLGSDRIENLSSKSAIMQGLDINQDGRGNLIKQFARYFTKFTDEDWERNILTRTQDFFNSGRSTLEQIEYLQKELGISRVEALRRMHDDNQVVNELFEKLASKNAIEQDTLTRLVNTLTSENFHYAGSEVSLNKVINLLELASEGDAEEILDYLSKTRDFTINTESLNDLLKQYKENTAEVFKRINIQSTSTQKAPIVDIGIDETNVMFIEGELRQAILKEITSEADVFGTAIRHTQINDQQLNSLSIFAQWQRFETATKGIHKFDERSFSIFNETGSYNEFVTGLSDEVKTEYIRSFEEMKSEFGLFHKGVDGNPNESYYSEFGAYEFIPTTKISSSQSIIENINTFIKEMNGGRDHLNNISPISIVAQYAVSRLSYGLDDSGLGLSHKSLSSPLNSIKNIALKRVLPVMAAYTAFDYLNDLSQDMTGVGITGAFANSVKNLDILGRGVAYNTGLGQALDWLKQTSVIGEYWTGSTDFQNVEERKEWYQSGYSPVRKARFWSFGSASEFRGGDVTFFQPNYWRRAQSDYHDKWLYGGNKEKWKHSIIPTPTHPLSTIRYLMDPYWLEKKHIDDAPTPLTGKMFSEGTPWGAVLNPTVGQVIKPVRMLPEVRKRLTGKGHDAKAIVKRVNERIKDRSDRRNSGASNKDLLVVNGTDIRNATYIPYGNPTNNELIITNGYAKGIRYMSGLSELSEYRVPEYVEPPQGEEYGGNYYGVNTNNHAVNKTANKAIGLINNVSGEISKTNNGLGQELIQGINEAIKGGASYAGTGGTLVGKALYRDGYTHYVNSSSPDSSDEGTYIYNNLVNEYNTHMATYYDEKFMPGFIESGLGSQTKDYVRDAIYSGKQLSGIYGFLADVVTGGPETTYRWENAGSYQSFSNRFWDAGVGGLGGGVMEIARRFFPSSDKSRVDYNPLRNNVADWLPDYLQVGNPFSKLTKGEMRLPGAGYESLNELHPDEYATDGYGAFDRFKILADVAPNSKEYKIWHNIVKHQTLQYNPSLKEEVEEIESRTKRMRGSHEFYEYQYLHTNTKYETGIVKEVTDDGKVILGDNKILTLAGIRFNQNYGGELNDLLTPGKEISYRVEDSVSYDDNNRPTRNAAIYVNAENINKQLMSMGVADRDKSDTSAIGQLATVSAAQESLGAIQELIAHARIPIIHNKLMHVETALESFKSEQMYGANFQTWDHPIESFIKPMLNETMGQSMFARAAAVAYGRFHFDKVLTSNVGKTKKFISGAILATLDPTAMMAGTVNLVTRLNNGRVGKGDKALGAWSAGAKFGSNLGTVAWGIANADNPLKAVASFTLASVDAYKKLEVGSLAWERFGRHLDVKGAAAIGAIAGLTMSALKNPDFDWDRMTEKWKPKKFNKMNEINEYFDRLEYVKYKGLYETAARKAALLEGSNIKAIFRDIDRNKKRIEKLKEKQRKLLEKHAENSSKYKAENFKIQEEIAALTQKGNQMFTGGKYTKAAVAYKKAMESTIYGLSEGATKDEILAAVPDQYKDYFQAFMDETDEGERKKILKHLPDYLKRPLQAAWGDKMEDVQSNTRYFRSHKLPKLNWRGWKPNVNLKHVKMKTIENEGMLLSDFGYYESEKAKPQYMMAPDIDNFRNGSGLGINVYTRLAAELKGVGVSLSNVSLEATSAPGLWVTSDIKQSISDRLELTTNSMSNAIQGIVANFI